MSETTPNIVETTYKQFKTFRSLGGIINCTDLLNLWIKNELAATGKLKKIENIKIERSWNEISSINNIKAKWYCLTVSYDITEPIKIIE